MNSTHGRRLDSFQHAASPPRLAAHDLVMTYGKGQTASHALSGVTIAFGAEPVAIMGPSGSGKTTLLHCLAGIVSPTSGQVALDGRDLTHLKDRERTLLRRDRFGFVFQSGQLLPELQAIENVALPLMLAGVPRVEAESRARGWLGPLGLGGLERRRPGQLSGGQAQRVAIARALVAGPAVVFADEPTGALDQETGSETMRVLVEATGAIGATLVVVTHDPVVASACSRIVRMHDGRIADDGRGSPSGGANRAGGVDADAFGAGGVGADGSENTRNGAAR